jgi:hypothetical protein
VKLRSGAISALAIGVTAVGALIGITGTGPASAATPSFTHLCLDNSSLLNGRECAQSDGSGQDVSLAPVAGDTTNWIYPKTSGAQGEIQQANTNLCMVREASCNGDLAEQWKNQPEAGRTGFVSLWVSQNEVPSGGGCLSSPVPGTITIGGALSADPCVGDWEEGWGTS